jgi:hypothetical protein
MLLRSICIPCTAKATVEVFLISWRSIQASFYQQVKAQRPAHCIHWPRLLAQNDRACGKKISISFKKGLDSIKRTKDLPTKVRRKPRPESFAPRRLTVGAGGIILLKKMTNCKSTTSRDAPAKYKSVICARASVGDRIQRNIKISKGAAKLTRTGVPVSKLVLIK